MRLRTVCELFDSDLTEGRRGQRSTTTLPEVNERSFGMRGANVTRRDAGPSYCSRISDDIALVPDALSRQWQSRITLQPTRTNYANEFRTGGAVVNERLARVFELHRAQKRFSADCALLIHVRALRIDDRAPFSTPLSFLSPVGRIGRVSRLAAARLPRIFPADCILRRERNIGIYNTKGTGRNPFRFPRIERHGVPELAALPQQR